jgi:glycosyltransferase involved in cell wall biosynthesis
VGSDAYRWNGTGSPDRSTPFFPGTPPAGKIAFEKLVADNAIINSTAVVRRSVFARSGLQNEQLALCEDYELWLRIAPLGEVWVMERALAIYRDAPQTSIREGLTPYSYYKSLLCVYSAALRGSHTTRSPLTYPENKQLALLCRRQLIRLTIQEFRRWAMPLLRALGKYVKLGLLAFGRLLGTLISFFIKNPDRSRPSIFMIFPFCHTGGAERVHADIIACFRQYLPRVLIVSRSDNTAFKKAFAEGSRLVDISFFCELLITRFIAMGFLAEWISRTENAVVFSSNSFLFCRMLPLFSEGVKKIDLTHAFSAGTELVSLPYVPLLDARVVISRKTADDFAALYAEHRIDPAYLERISIIENKVPVPPAYREKPFGKKKILFVGRGSPEKRVHLVGRIAHAYAALDPEASFTLVGDVQQRILPGDCPYCIFAGEILDDSILAGMYREAHVLLITSEREGLPLVLMEAMAHGVVPVSTNVGAIGAHVQNGSNGFLIEARDEESLAAAFVAAIKQALSDQNDYQHLSLNAHRCVLEKSARNDDFCRDYVRLLVGQNSNPGKKRGAES